MTKIYADECLEIICTRADSDYESSSHLLLSSVKELHQPGGKHRLKNQCLLSPEVLERLFQDKAEEHWERLTEFSGVGIQYTEFYFRNIWLGRSPIKIVNSCKKLSNQQWKLLWFCICLWSMGVDGESSVLQDFSPTAESGLDCFISRTSAAGNKSFNFRFLFSCWSQSTSCSEDQNAHWLSNGLLQAWCLFCANSLLTVYFASCVCLF